MIILWIGGGTLNSHFQLKKIELKWRDLLITFAAVLYLSSFLDKAIPQLLDVLFFHIPIYIPLLLLVCYPMAVILRKEIGSIFDVEKENWEGEEGSKEKWKVFYRYLGLTALYFITQLGLCVLIVPEFISFRFLNLPFFAIVFLFNCYCICWVYSKTIYKSSARYSYEQ